MVCQLSPICNVNLQRSDLQLLFTGTPMLSDDGNKVQDVSYFRIPSSSSSFFALATLTPPSPSPSISSIYSFDFDDFPIFFVDSVAQSSVESSPMSQSGLLTLESSVAEGLESLSSVCSFGTFGPRRDAALFGLAGRVLGGNGAPSLDHNGDDSLALASPCLSLNRPSSSAGDSAYLVSGPPGLEAHATVTDIVVASPRSNLELPSLDPSLPHKEIKDIKHTIRPQKIETQVAMKDRRPGAERKHALSPPPFQGNKLVEFVWLHGISIDLLIDQEGFRSATPSFRYSGVNRSQMDQTTCTVTFKATPNLKQGLYFHYNPFDSSPVLRRVTVHGEESKDYISKQAQLTMKANGIYSVQGAEISSLSPIHSRIFNQLGHEPDKLDWEFRYLVDDRLDTHGRPINGEKKFVPLTFTCSPWLLHPSQGKRVNLIHIFKKGVSAKLTAEKFTPPPMATIPEISISGSDPGSPTPVQGENLHGPTASATLHRRARSHATRNAHTEAGVPKEPSDFLPKDSGDRRNMANGSASVREVRRRASSAGEGSWLSMSM